MSGREVRVEICSNTVRVFNEADEVVEFYVNPVSYTHLTLPTN